MYLSAEMPAPMVRVPRRHHGRWVAGLLLIALLLCLVRAFAHGAIGWHTVGRFFFNATIIAGLGNTALMTVCASALGISIGVVVAIMMMSANPVLKSTAIFYIWIFRGTPILLQLLIWFNLALIFPTIGIPGLWEARTVDLITPFVATLLGLGINKGAYAAEVVRAGILSVDRGQFEAAQTIGMTRLQSLRRIIVPQAMRVIIPPLGNETISMVKLTSVASVIQFPEILRNAENIYYANSQVVELLLVAAAWYLIIVSLLSIGQQFLERYFSKGHGSLPRRAVPAEAQS